MAESSSSSNELGFMARHHFLLRRLHSLSGIIPVGVFVIFHLFTNAQLATDTYQHEVDWLYRTVPVLLLVEISLWIAIAFHAGLGLVYTFVGSKNNVSHYRYGGNWRYFFQRVTGIIALVFIFLHVATMRWHWDIFGWYTPFMVDYTLPDGQRVPMATASVAVALQSIPVVIFYLVGSLSVVYHWSNGLWTAAITWGITLSVAAQRRWGVVCAAMGITLTVFTFAALYGAMTYELNEQERMAYELYLAEGPPEIDEGEYPLPLDP
ncbi:hypothetical protein ACERK3_05970 [Phycisphaerales bacterium AB-hyl4]|uniref:Succinate dehydrogenase subunit C n=1 Tax=Natronomicrosphaera hydrolytica TaxID=3242702 RepID=A0ABV4U2M6_9BACT